MGTTVPSDSLSESIVRDLWRAQLQAGIADPVVSTRPAKSPLVVTAIPDRNRYYPHIIVAEASDTSKRPDIRADVWLHTYTVTIEIHSRNQTHLFQLRDRVRGWIESNVSTLNANNFHDAEIVSSTQATWDATDEVRKWRIAVRGTVYTAPSEE